MSDVVVSENLKQYIGHLMAYVECSDSVHYKEEVGDEIANDMDDMWRSMSHEERNFANELCYISTKILTSYQIRTDGAV